MIDLTLINQPLYVLGFRLDYLNICYTEFVKHYFANTIGFDVCLFIQEFQNPQRL